jgi:hypothetical protein
MHEITSTAFKLALMETISKISAVAQMCNFTLDNIKVGKSTLSQLSRPSSTVTYDIYLNSLTPTQDIINSLNAAVYDGTFLARLRESCSFKNITASGTFTLMDSKPADGDGTIALSKYKLGTIKHIHFMFLLLFINTLLLIIMQSYFLSSIIWNL